jgi:Ser/Thr protein kinase RdoA (MazF antagonist)
MNPYEELTRLGRIRRMRQIAKSAMNAYGLTDVRVKFLREAGNTLFRVSETSPALTSGADLYTPGQYMLRIHQPGYQTSEAIELELAWLAAMCREAALPVPEPVPTREGLLLSRVTTPGIQQERNCSLLRWVKGRFITRGIQPRHYRAQGRLMGRLHKHAAHWRPSMENSKRKYDYEGLFQQDAGTGIPASQAWALLPPQYKETFESVAEKVKRVMEEWGKGPEVYGLIHADLGLDANVLFWRGEARAIDFDDSGFGYYLYDLSLALEHCQEDKALPRFKDALLEGYAEIRPISDNELASLDLFLAAFWVYLSLWAAAAVETYPKHKLELLGRMERAFRLTRRYLETN